MVSVDVAGSGFALRVVAFGCWCWRCGVGVRGVVGWLFLIVACVVRLR